jgi:O-acetyl-ADP-ribose deacetylase (regulator of RNase III)
MLKYLQTTVFNSGAQTIVNTVNCFGAMGAGLALEFKLRYPDMEQDYQSRCRRKEVCVGRPYLYKGEYSAWILNFPTKNHWKQPSELSWIEDGLQYFRNRYKHGKISSAAFPKLGCSHGGLEWALVRPLMERYLGDLDIDIFICLDEENTGSGVEGKMLDILNDPVSNFWTSSSSSSIRGSSKIRENLPINRFRDIRRLHGIGKKAYEAIFKQLYKEVNQVTSVAYSHDFVQTSLLDNDKLLDLNEQNKIYNSEEFLLLGSEQVTAFQLVWPELQKILSTPRTREEVAEFLDIPKTLASSWIKKGVEFKKIKRLSRKPTKYLFVS